MTRSTRSSRDPGAILLEISKWLFDADFLSSVVQPTIADLQREVAEAGHSRVKRLRARWRGYRAFWMVALAAPFAIGTRRNADVDVASRPDVITRLAVTAIVLMLVGLVGPVLGAWVTMVAASSALVAILLHRWNALHPSRIPTPTPLQMWSPQINFSSTDVAANVGGLIFVVGSVVVVVIGVPSVIWFLFAGAAAGCLLAWGLIRWHTRHPAYGLPANRIALR